MPLGVQGRADDLVAGALVDRQRLAGEHRLVDGRGTLDDDAVDRHLLARAHAHEVVVDDLGDRHVDLDAVAHHARRARLQADQRADGVAGLAAGARFEQAAEQDEGDDERGRVEVHRHAQTVVVEEAGEEHAGGAVEVGGRRPQGDEGVHGGAAVARRGQGGAVELAADPELHRRGERPEHPAAGQKARARRRSPCCPGRRAPTAWRRRRPCGAGAGRRRGGRGLGVGIAGRSRRRRRAVRWLRRRAGRGRLDYLVAGPPHRRREVVAAGRPGQILDGGLLGGQIDGRAARRAPGAAPSRYAPRSSRRSCRRWRGSRSPSAPRSRPARSWWPAGRRRSAPGRRSPWPSRWRS